MGQEEPPDVGELLRHYRLRASLSQEELAERAGLTAEAIGQLERGRRRRPQPHTIRALADALGLRETERAELIALARAPALALAAPAPAPTTPAQSPAPPASTLPMPLTTFVGRERELTAAGLFLAEGRRLLTLTGPGGTGKTRLAVEGTRAVAHNFPDGVWFVDLVPLTDAHLMPQTVATALRIPETAGRSSTEQVVAAIGGRRALLVLDNCEHQLDACAELVAALLRGCPGLTIVATSREPLALAGEQVCPVPPLPLPPADVPAATADDAAALAEFAAVRLFVDRARSARPDFGLTAANAGAVAQICRRLDGLPLAIELAAARVRVLAPERIAAHLDDRFRLLSGGSRLSPTRHQTLHGLIEWSHDLLAEPERVLFRRLAVFAGGCSLEAAEAVCGDERIEAWQVLDLLTALADQSLVVVEQQGEAARYRLLESIREYAQEKLADTREQAAVRARHFDWCLSYAEGITAELRGPTQVVWLARLEEDHDNLRAALRWVTEQGEIERGLRLAVALVPFWEGHSHLSEGRRWLEALLAAPSSAVTPSQRAQALIGAGQLAQWQGDLTTAVAWFGAALALARAARDAPGIAESLACLSVPYRRQGAFTRAVELLEESMALARELGDPRLIAFTLLNLGVTAVHRGEYARGQTLLEECLPLYRQLGDLRYTGITLTMLGQTVRAEGNLKRARALLREGLSCHVAVGDRASLVFNLHQWAALTAESRPESAARLLGAAHTLRDVVGSVPAPINRVEEDEVIAAVSARLPEAEFRAAWAAGRALRPEQAVADALAGLTADAQTAHSG